MKNTNNSQKKQLTKWNQISPNYFLFARKDYAIEELLTFLSDDFLDLTYQNNVLPTESPFPAVRVSLPSLNNLIIVTPSFNYYNPFFCDNCPSLGQQIKS